MPDATDTSPADATGNDVLVVLVTVPDEASADAIARTLVEERLAACCNVLSNVRSIYRWEEAVEEASELLLTIKTTRSRFDQLAERITALHPYDVPEVIALGVEAGSESYLSWVRGVIR